MHQAIRELLSAQGIEYILLDPELKIVDTSARVQTLVDSPDLALPGEDIRQGFPELFGVEDFLQAVLQGEQQQFEFKGVARVSAEGQMIYLDLRVVCLHEDGGGSPQLMVLLNDVSDRMGLEQTLVQSTNEMGLLVASLEASHKYINKVVGSMADALLVAYADGTIKTVNRAAKEWFGYTEAELVGQPITKAISDEQFAFEELHAYLKTRSEYVKDLEVSCSTKTGEKRLVAFSCSLIDADRHNGCEFLYVGRDITASRQAQSRFLAQYRVAQIVSVAIAIDQAMLPVLKTIGENLDWAAGEFWLLESNVLPHLKRIATCSKPADADSTVDCFGIAQFLEASESPTCGLANRAWQAGEPQWVAHLQEHEDFPHKELAARAQLQSALAIPIESSQCIYGVMVFFSTEVKPRDDDTLQTLSTIATQLGQFIQRKQAEAALQESEERYRDLFENASDLILSVDPEGRFLYANRAWQEAMGYSSEQLKEMSLFELLLPKEKIKFAIDFRKVLMGETLEQIRTMFATQDGRSIVLEGSINSKQVEGKTVAARAMFRDITQRLATEAALHDQQQRAERLLLNVLPAQIAAKLKQDHKTIAEKFERATVLFADITNFTELSGQLSPIKLVDLLNVIFSQFDCLTELHGLEKIKTIGDAYMVVGGVPESRPDSVQAVADFALDMQTAIAQFNRDRDYNLSMRVGIHTGPVVAGVIGLKKFIYDLWGDTVNIASRMESHGVPGRIQVTQEVCDYLQGQYNFEYRGRIPIKGKGNMDTYWLLGRRS
jgi:adenylate cyclase